MEQTKTDEIFDAITSYDCRDMTKTRFHQGVNEAIRTERKANRLDALVGTDLLAEINICAGKEWDKMGDTGDYNWMKKLDELGEFGDEVYHFGRFRVLEDLQNFAKKIPSK